MDNNNCPYSVYINKAHRRQSLIDIHAQCIEDICHARDRDILEILIKLAESIAKLLNNDNDRSTS